MISRVKPRGMKLLVNEVNLRTLFCLKLLLLYTVKAYSEDLCAGISHTSWQIDTGASNCFMFTDGMDWVATDKTTPTALPTNCDMSGVTDYFAWYDLGSNTNFISTIVVVTDFRNAVGQATSDDNDPATFQLFLTDYNPSLGSVYT